MDRRQFLVRTSLAATASLLPFHKLWALSEGNFTDLRRNVGFFTDRGGTIGWLASDDGFVVVDSQYPETAKGCLTGLQQKTTHSLDMLINTHHHGDHTNGNPVFRPVAKKIVAHENVPGLMKKAADQSDSDDDTNPAYPDTTYEGSWKTDVGDETIRLNHYGPAHTGGDSVVYFEKANIVHMGDLIFNRMNPYTDRPAGASILNWIETLSTVESKYPSDAIFIFGHGKPEFGVTGKQEDLAVMRRYLSAMVEYVEDGIEAGKSKEEIVDKKVIDGFENFLYADFWTASQNLDVVYQELMED